MSLGELASSRTKLIVVKVAYDPEARVWYVEHSDIAGLRAEAETADALFNRIPEMLVDLIEENEGGTGEYHIEIIASANKRVHVPEAA